MSKGKGKAPPPKRSRRSRSSRASRATSSTSEFDVSDDSDQGLDTDSTSDRRHRELFDNSDLADFDSSRMNVDGSDFEDVQETPRKRKVARKPVVSDDDLDFNTLIKLKKISVTSEGDTSTQVGSAGPSTTVVPGGFPEIATTDATTSDSG